MDCVEVFPAQNRSSLAPKRYRAWVPLTLKSLKTSDGKTWETYRTYSLVSGVTWLVMLIMFIYTMNALHHGATERALIAPPFLWLVISGMRVRDATNEGDD